MGHISDNPDLFEDVCDYYKYLARLARTPTLVEYLEMAEPDRKALTAIFMRQEMTCPKCKDSGQVVVEPPGQQRRLTLCQNCGGSGKIKTPWTPLA